MKKSELSNFLEIKDGNIILPIDKYEFVLSPKSAENMVVALRGALRLLTSCAPNRAKRAAKKVSSVTHKSAKGRDG